jgi:hypothetical protein
MLGCILRVDCRPQLRIPEIDQFSSRFSIGNGDNRLDRDLFHIE